MKKKKRKYMLVRAGSQYMLLYPRNFGMGFLYGEACGELARGGRCVLTLGHSGPHQSKT